MSLHEGEPCTSCGLRFRDDQRDEYQAHLDWHYHENRLDKDGTRATMRNWFLHPDVSNNNNNNNNNNCVLKFCDALVYGRRIFKVNCTVALGCLPAQCTFTLLRQIFVFLSISVFFLGLGQL